MKKQLLPLIAVLLALGLTGCHVSGNVSASGSASASAVRQTLLLGIFEPQTGETGSDGLREALGIQYAQSLRPTATVDGITYDVVLDWQDSQSAQAAAQKLVSDGCTAVIGSCDANACIAAGATFSDAELPALSPSCTDANVTLGNDYYFQTGDSADLQGAALADWASAQDYQEIATLNQLSNPYTANLVAAFTSQFEKNGGKVVAAETFQADATDFNASLTRIKDSGVKAVYAPTDSSYAAPLLNQAADLKLDVQWIAGDAWNTPTLLLDAGAAAEGVVLNCAYGEGVNPDFDQGFQAWLEADSTRLAANQGGHTISASQALAFDAYNSILDAIEAASSLDGLEIRDALANQEQTDALTGTRTFDLNGDPVRTTTYLLESKDGAFVLADTISHED